jgi:CDP-diacylglycerol--glycerol-3-phosphate 3-phosphatidyltransferase
MLARSCARCGARARIAIPRSPNAVRHATMQHRHYSMPSGAASASSAGSGSGSGGAGMIAPFVTELDRMAPRFDLRGDQIRIIRTPAEFYETLKVHTYIHGMRVQLGLVK